MENTQKQQQTKEGPHKLATTKTQHTVRCSLEVVLLHAINGEVVSGVRGGYRRHHNQQRDKEQKGQRKTTAKHFHHFFNFVKPHDGIWDVTTSN